MIANHLLVVDDEPGICELVSELAAELGFETASATTHAEFHERWRSFKPAVVILDLTMPEGNGIELLRALAREGCEAQILIFSGLDSSACDAAVRVGSELGLQVVGALQKPIRLANLEAALRPLAAAP